MAHGTGGLLVKYLLTAVFTQFTLDTVGSMRRLILSAQPRISAVTRRVIRVSVLCALLGTTTWFVPAVAGERKVLTIAVDGLRPDALIAANTPNIDSLVNGTFFATGGASGIFATYAQAEHLTYSGPGWGAYLTGLHVDRHGADTNDFQNVVPGTTDWLAALEAFDPTLDTRRVLTWEIAHNSIPSGADIAEVYEFSSNGDQLLTDRVVQLIADPATDVVMTFMSDVDCAGHICGFDPTAPCYLDEITDTDAKIGDIMTAMASRPNFSNEDWLVIITSDHGGLGNQHRGGLPPQRTIPYIVAGPLATTVLPQAHPRLPDVAATVLDYFGAPLPANYDGLSVGLTAAGPAPAVLNQTSSSMAMRNTAADSTSTQRSSTHPDGKTLAQVRSPPFITWPAAVFQRQPIPVLSTEARTSFPAVPTRPAACRSAST